MPPQLGFPWGCCLFISILLLCSVVSGDDDGAAMEAIRKAINPAGWNGSDHCNWAKVTCCTNSRSVCRIQIGNQKLSGELPPVIKTLIQLQTLEAMDNQLTGPLPSLSGLTSLQIVLLNNNNFTLFPDDFFVGLSSLSTIDISYNSFDAWRIPESLKQATAMRSFSANDANISGNIPDFLGNDVMAGLSVLRLALNQLEGELPESFSGWEIQTLWLNGNNLNGTIGVIQSMTSLTQVWLQGNQFTGPLPDFSNLASLKDFNARDNQLTGVVPSSLVKLNPNVTLSNNLLQGPMPSFSSSAQVDIQDGNRFCTQKEGGDCDPRVDVLLSIVKEMGYPNNLAADWVGNDPCHKNGGGFWLGLTCSAGGNITGINFGKMGLTGTISSNFSLLTSLQTLKLNDNLLNGTIPEELTRLPNLKNVDLSNNKLYGKVPSFGPNVTINVAGNTDIGKDNPSVTPPGAPTGPDSNKKSKTGVIVGVVVGSVVGLVLTGLLVFCLIKRTQRRSNRVQSPNILVIRPHQSSDQNAVKISVANRVNVSGGEPHTINGPNDIHVEAGNMIISIQVLRSVTNNFSEDKILGKGGFGTVYEGELHDGTKIAVKRMESGVVAEKGLNEFKSEIAVLTKVRHRHLVGLLGYCLDGNERLLVYEHMPQGTLSRHLFHWKDEGLQPLEWTRRLIIALDVARGVEYLHGLANEIFIHRDLKPSNILLGDDMRAKVADFGLVRLAPAGKGSIETRLAGTFGYLAPEYAATGRMTLKVDVYSFGVILMELITGRKAIDESQPEESCHLVTWFRRKVIKTEALPEIVDPTIDVTEETLSSIRTVAELAGHCSAREPYQRPDMGHAVNVLSSLVEQWKPSKQEDIDEMGAINFDVPLNEAVKRWQAAEGTSNVDESIPSSIFPRGFHSETSTPNRPSGFPNSFTSSDGR